MNCVKTKILHLQPQAFTFQSVPWLLTVKLCSINLLCLTDLKALQLGFSSLRAVRSSSLMRTGGDSVPSHQTLGRTEPWSSSVVPQRYWSMFLGGVDHTVHDWRRAKPAGSQGHLHMAMQRRRKV